VINPLIGFDFSGIVADVGSAVTHFRPGDEVFGMSRAEYANKPEGANAQFVVVKEKVPSSCFPLTID
jgi:NADPH:quinone reductase-like Zn-dependent oxidoreductase